MANMSYCRFENTSNDLCDCIGALENCEEFMTLADFREELSSDDERRGFDRLLKLAKDLVELAEQMEG